MNVKINSLNYYKFSIETVLVLVRNKLSILFNNKLEQIINFDNRISNGINGIIKKMDSHTKKLNVSGKLSRRKYLIVDI